jgi:hypothetical protein
MRKIIYRFSGIESVAESLNPFYYLSKIFFKLFSFLNGKSILHGPFKGMILADLRRGSEYAPKYLGTYESELYPYFDEYKSVNKPTMIIDIGADDGYYSIGLSKTLERGVIYSYELNPDSCVHLQKNIEINRELLNKSIQIQVINKKIENFLDIRDILETHKDYSILIKSDIEGGEYDLFQESFIKSLSKYPLTILIETHLSLEMENNLIDNFIKNGFKTEMIDKIYKKNKIYYKHLNLISRILLFIYWNNWTNEHRPKFNRWIKLSNI